MVIEWKIYTKIFSLFLFHVYAYYTQADNRQSTHKSLATTYARDHNSLHKLRWHIRRPALNQN